MKEYTDVRATVRSDGGLRISNTEMGPDVEARFGDYDLESWFDLSPDDLPMAMAAVLHHAFSQRKRMDLQSLVACLKAVGIEPKWDVWV